MGDVTRNVPGPASPEVRKAKLAEALAGDSGKPRVSQPADPDHAVLLQVHGALGRLLGKDPRQPMHGGKTIDQTVDDAIAGAKPEY
jgi:hypothetical protein